MKKMKVGDVYYFNEELYTRIESQTKRIASQLNQAQALLKIVTPFELPERAILALSEGIQFQKGSTLWNGIEQCILEDLKNNSLGELLKDKALESAFNKFYDLREKFSRMFDLFFVEDYAIRLQYQVINYISRVNGIFIADERKLSELKTSFSRTINTENQLKFYNMLKEWECMGKNLADFYNENRVDKANYELPQTPYSIINMFFDKPTGNLLKNPSINLINRK